MRRHGDRDFLFNSIDWFSVERHQRKRMTDEIDGIDANRLLNTSVEDLCTYLADKYRSTLLSSRSRRSLLTRGRCTST